MSRLSSPTASRAPQSSADPPAQARGVPQRSSQGSAHGPAPFSAPRTAAGAAGCYGAALLERVCRCPSLPAMPAVAVELLRATAERDADLARLARVATKDAALVAGVLRAANASHYGLRHRITSVSQAVPVLGLRNLRTLVAGLALLPAIGKSRHSGIDPSACSRRGLYSAAAARRLAERFGAPRPDDCFLCALLMDLGTLALAEVLGAPYADLVARAGRHADLDRLEREELGVGHAEVGAALVRRWQLPEGLAPPIQFHHDPDATPEGPDRLSARVLALAGLCADVFLEHNPLWPIAECYRLAEEWFGRGKAETDLLLEGLAAETQELGATFEVKVDASATFAHARRRVAEEFGAAPAPGYARPATGNGAKPAAGPAAERPARAPQIGVPQGGNQRRENRSPRAGGMTVIPCTAAGVGQPLRAELRDVSPSGIGLVFPVAVKVGSRFVVGLRQSAGRVTVVLYEVRHCEAPAGGGVAGLNGFNVGAELVRAMREQELRNERQGDSPLHRIGRALLGPPAGGNDGDTNRPRKATVSAAAPEGEEAAHI